MSLAAQIGQRAVHFENATRVEEFIGAVRHLMLSRDNYQSAAQIGRAAHLNERQVDFLTKAATSAGSTTDPSWSALAPHPLAAAFLASLVGTSVYETMRGSMIEVPLRTSVVSVSATLTGGTVAEASVKPVSRLSLTAGDIDPFKDAALIAISAELLKIGGARAENLLRKELTSALVRVIDQQFLALITAGAPSFASSGVTGLAIKTDLARLLQNVAVGSASRLFLITTPTICKTWSMVPEAGPLMFDLMGYRGGEISGIPVLPSDQLASGTVVLADASAIATGVGALLLDTSTQSTFQLNDAPDSPPAASTSVVSLWQQDLVGLRAERIFGAKLLRSGAVARVTGAVYTGNSPS